jgi:hypothetical protein
VRLDLDRLDDRRKFALVVLAAVVVGVALFGAGFLVATAVGGDDDESSVVAPSVTPTARKGTPTRTRTPATTTTATTVASTSTPAVASTSAPARPPTPVPPTPTSTPDFTKQPAVEVTSIDPPLGTHIELASVDIALGVTYQAGRDSNTLGWELLYCAAPNDCNTYGFNLGTPIAPGSSGQLTLGGPFPAGGNYLRPIVVCRYTVVISHFVTPEAQWQSQLSNDERCQGERRAAVKVTGTSPNTGTVVNSGDVVSVYVEYDAYNADQLLVTLYMGACRPAGVKTVDLPPDTTGVTTVIIASSPPSATGTLQGAHAQLLRAGSTVASYGFGAC